MSIICVIISCVSWEISRSRGGSSLQEAPGLLCLKRSQEVRGSVQPQNGGLRALEEAWMMTFGLRHSPVLLWTREGLAEGSDNVKGNPRTCREA